MPFRMSPTPWHIEEDPDGPIILDANNHRVAEVYAEVDGDLIAKAWLIPDLLAALGDAIRELCIWADNSEAADETDEAVPVADEIITRAETLMTIAKAEGAPDTFNVVRQVEPDDEAAALEQFRPIEGE